MAIRQSSTQASSAMTICPTKARKVPIKSAVVINSSKTISITNKLPITKMQLATTSTRMAVGAEAVVVAEAVEEGNQERIQVSSRARSTISTGACRILTTFQLNSKKDYRKSWIRPMGRTWTRRRWIRCSATSRSKTGRCPMVAHPATTIRSQVRRPSLTKMVGLISSRAV